MRKEEALRLRSVIEQSVASLADEAALKGVTLFPEWVSGKEYTIGERFKYDGVLYKVLLNHTAQTDWRPDEAASLYARVLIADPEIIPEWEQPESTNGYAKGDKVKHNDKTWMSTVDNNVWEPGAYGWEEM